MLETINIYYPPEAVESDPVGRIDVITGIGGCMIEGTFLNMKLKPKHISNRLPLFNKRVKLVASRMKKQVEFQAAMQLDYTSAE